MQKQISDLQAGIDRNEHLFTRIEHARQIADAKRTKPRSSWSERTATLGG